MMYSNASAMARERFSVGVFYLLAAVLAWRLGEFPAETLTRY
jgi:hypothetical protein